MRIARDQTAAWCLGAVAMLVLCDLAVLAPLPPFWTWLGALIGLVLLPGALLTMTLAPDDEPASALERAVLSVGLGYGGAILGLLLLQALPGPLHRWQILIPFNVLSLLLLARAWWQPRNRWQLFSVPAHWLLAGCALVVLSCSLRLAHLGHSEFQGDEVAVLQRAAAVVLGDDQTLYAHRKGPAEILLVSLGYGATRRVSESAARLPFALASLVSAACIYLIGKQCSSRRAGWWAALIITVDGLLVAFGRIVQYQSLVVMYGSLGLLCALRYDERQNRRNLWLSAVFLALGLLAHSDGIFAVAPAGMLVLGGMWRRRVGWRPGARALIGPASLAAAILITFYLPYALHPQASGTASYWASRLGSPPYNHLLDHLTLLTAYSPIYYIALLGLGLCAFALHELSLAGRIGWLSSLIGGLLLLSPVLLGDLMRIGTRDLAVIPFATLFLWLLWLRRRHLSRGVLLVWFALPFLLYTFLSLDPRTHIYAAIPGAALLIGIELDRLGHLGNLWGWLSGGLALGLVALSVFYSWVAFVRTDPEYQRSFPEHRIPLFWAPYGDDFPSNAVFGFPHLAGWKAIGALYAEGELEGSYASNEENHITQWYTRGQPNCARLPHYYLLASHVQDPIWVDDEAIQERYDLVGRVWVSGRPTIEIHQLEPATQAYRDYGLDGVAYAYDLELTEPSWARRPIVHGAYSLEQVPGGIWIGESIELVGYRLDPHQARAGDAMRLTLYWRAKAPISQGLNVFTHIEDQGALWGQKDNVPGCGASPTISWPPGRVIMDPYTIEVSREAPAGEYRLLVGMYDLATGARSPVTDATGASLGDAVDLGMVRITER